VVKYFNLLLIEIKIEDKVNGWQGIVSVYSFYPLACFSSEDLFKLLYIQFDSTKCPFNWSKFILIILSCNKT